MLIYSDLFGTFQEFKERFVQLLPEIIDVSTNTDSIEKAATSNLAKINVNSKNRLSRREIHLLCEITPELNRSLCPQMLFT